MSSNSGGIFDIPGKQEQLAILERNASSPEFWNDAAKAQKVQRQIKELQEWVEAWQSLDREVQDLASLAELAAEEKDAEVLKDAEASVPGLEKRLSELELRKMLGGEDDARPAIISIHPGAGGTESQDWARMLLRMYSNWFVKKGFKVDVLDEQPAEDAGIKGATLEVTGDHAGKLAACGRCLRWRGWYAVGLLERCIDWADEHHQATDRRS